MIDSQSTLPSLPPSSGSQQRSGWGIMPNTLPRSFIRRNWLASMVSRMSSSLMVGAASAFGSMGWFTAMSLQRVAYVKALAQVEFIFALGVSYLFFGERSNRTELGGMALVAAGILILVLFAR